MIDEADQRRQEELDELVAVLKRMMYDALEKGNHSAVLRAADQIARFRGLNAPRAKSRKPEPPSEPPSDPSAAAAPSGVSEQPEGIVEAKAKRIVGCFDAMERLPPALRKQLFDRAPATGFFDADFEILPRERWPERREDHGLR
ncbi:hypothetical protein N825_03410 [Skermanella stibiiresistens SB22]|uniref:Uncharacterized protein n=1 Tax=Skermanella stibiiresistens SB22 TaxID=1385369 RepID=W9H1U6_9PROT|nr:hypothetical protein N825_03410 [Skermanella stibiiresistens SB22]